MTHNEKRGHWAKEALINQFTGSLFGFVYVGVAYPLDIVYTKMQAQKGFENINTLNTFAKIIKTDGVRGLYRYNYCVYIV
jgi:hypothetical protein